LICKEKARKESEKKGEKKRKVRRKKITTWIKEEREGHSQRERTYL
jgi:hypothetical protein